MKVPYIAWLTFHEARRRRLVPVGVALGLAFLAVYGLGFYLLRRDLAAHGGVEALAQREMPTALTMMGLYAVNFMVTMISVLISVDTISGEIASHSIQSIVTKPLRRWEVILGKWLGFTVMVTGVVVLLAGGVVLISYALSGFLPDNLAAGIALLALSGLVLLSLTLLGGTLFSTLTNGVIVFMLYILAFIGGWTEQFGAVLHNDAAINVGIVSSLLMPTEAIWKRAAYLMQPSSLINLMDSPFVTSSVPSPAMVMYAVLYGALALFAAIRIFSRKDL